MVNRMMLLFKEDLGAYNSERGMSMNLVEVLCSIGSDGSYGGNCHRDLVLRLPGSAMPSIHYFQIPLKHPIAGRMEPDIGMILPHEMFSSLYHNYPEAFAESVMPAGSLESFWRSVQGGDSYWGACLQVP